MVKQNLSRRHCQASGVRTFSRGVRPVPSAALSTWCSVSRGEGAQSHLTGHSRLDQWQVVKALSFLLGCFGRTDCPSSPEPASLAVSAPFGRAGAGDAPVTPLAFTSPPCLPGDSCWPVIGGPGRGLSRVPWSRVLSVHGRPVIKKALRVEAPMRNSM